MRTQLLTNDVSQRPHGLLTHILMRRLEKSQKQWDSIYTDREREHERRTYTDQLHTEQIKSKQADPVEESLSKQRTGFDHCLCLRRRPWCNVGQSPGSFKLQWRTDEERERQVSSDVFEVVGKQHFASDHSEFRVTFCDTLNWALQDFPTGFCVCSQNWPLKAFFY